ncbi:MAG: response regulator, partial [Chryseobacterium sp.]
MIKQKNSYRVIFHADDDEDDRMLFADAVAELDLAVKVKQAQDGQKLLDILYSGTLE